MLIDFKNNKVFYHIPKVAGMTARKELLKQDKELISINDIKKNNGEYIDETHLTREEVSLYDSELFERIRNFDNFLLIREPISRFHSAMAQYIRNYSSYDYFSISHTDYESLSKEIINQLRNEFNIFSPFGLPYNLVHFKPQITYLKNLKLGDSTFVYTIENIDKLISSFLDYQVTIKKEVTNSSYVLNNFLPAYIMDISRFMIKPFSSNIREKIKRYASGSFLITPNKKFNINSDINHMVKDLYIEDFRIYDFHKNK
jgi:hypothetical protein